RGVAGLEIAPALEGTPGPRLDQHDLGLKHQAAAADAALVDERTHGQKPLPAHHLPADYPIERAAVGELLGALRHHASGVDVLGLLAAGAATFFADPGLEILHRVAADAELDQMKGHAKVTARLHPAPRVPPPH